MKNQILNILNFFKKPEDKKEKFDSKFSFFLVVIILDIFVTGIFTTIGYILEQIGISTGEHELEKMFEQYSVILIGITAVLILPFFEEVFFRLPLRYETNYFLKIYQSLTGFGSIEKRQMRRQKLKDKWHKYYPVYFYLSALLFSLVHLSNYSGDDLNIITALVITLLPLFYGMLFGVIRVKISFWAAFLYHAIHNLVSIIFLLNFT
jgi:membrane protease YdiL (CAAX protease family)